MKNEKKNTHGGPGRGQGRKRWGKEPRVRLGLTYKPAHAERLKAMEPRERAEFLDRALAVAFDEID